MTPEKKLQTLNESRMAIVVLEHFNGLIESEKNTLLVKMKQMAREGKHDVVSYAGSLLAINSLDDIQMRAKKRVTEGNRLGEELT